MTAPKGKYPREPHDWYVEPAAAVDALFEAERFVGTVWDPAAGQGTIPAVATARGYRAAATDLVDRGEISPGVIGGLDFLKPRESWPAAARTNPVLSFGADNIVTNPPFGLATPFVRQALAMARFKVAALVRLAWLESAERLPLFRESPLARLLVFSNRIACLPGSRMHEIKRGGGQERYCWLVWSHDHRGPATVDWIVARSQPAPAAGPERNPADEPPLFPELAVS